MVGHVVDVQVPVEVILEEDSQVPDGVDSEDHELPVQGILQ